MTPEYYIKFIYLFIYLFLPWGLRESQLIPWPGIEPVPPAVEVHSPNHWTAREVPDYMKFKFQGP